MFLGEFPTEMELAWMLCDAPGQRTLFDHETGEWRYNDDGKWVVDHGGELIWARLTQMLDDPDYRRWQSYKRMRNILKIAKHLEYMIYRPHGYND